MLSLIRWKQCKKSLKKSYRPKLEHTVKKVKNSIFCHLYVDNFLCMQIFATFCNLFETSIKFFVIYPYCILKKIVFYHSSTFNKLRRQKPTKWLKKRENIFFYKCVLP
jgi:hypothetical protein